MADEARQALEAVLAAPTGTRRLQQLLPLPRPLPDPLQVRAPLDPKILNPETQT